MKLNKKQREKLKELVATGLLTDEINAITATFKPPLQVTRQQVDGYRKRLEPKISEILKERELSPLMTGIAIKENRISLLQQLAEEMKKDLLEKKRMWVVNNYRMVGRGEDAVLMEYEEFNQAEVNQLRGVLDDVAKEVGGRVNKTALTDSQGKDLIDLEKIDFALRKIYGEKSGNNSN